MAIDTNNNATEKDVISSILDKLIENVSKCKWQFEKTLTSSIYTLYISQEEWIVLRKIIVSHDSAPVFSLSIYKKDKKDFHALADIPNSENKNNEEHLKKIKKLFNIIEKITITEKGKQLDTFLNVLNKLVEDKEELN